LISQGYDPNAFDALGNTPLHYAAKNEHFHIVAFLLSQGANVNAHDEARIGNTPLTEIAGSCSLKMAQMLSKPGPIRHSEAGCNSMQSTRQRIENAAMARLSLISCANTQRANGRGYRARGCAFSYAARRLAVLTCV
jgi:hypothetical protein